MSVFLSQHSTLIAQIFGFSAMATAIAMYQFKKHKTIMLLTVLCSGLWCLHFAFLGLVTPIFMNAINVIRGIVYSNRDKKWGGSRVIPYLFSAAAIAVTVLTWESAWGILTCVASIFATFANWQTDTKRLKILTIPVCVCWFTYNCVNRSWAGMANETFACTSIIVALIRLAKEKRAEIHS